MVHFGTLLLGIVALAGASSACHHQSPLANLGNSVADPETVYLEVENHNWSDVNIYVRYDGRTERLTQVTAARDATLPIPRRMMGDLCQFSLIARRVGGKDVYVSPPVCAKTGYTVRFTIEDALVRSSVGVW